MPDPICLTGERVKDVRVTHRLTDSPACLVTGEDDMRSMGSDSIYSRGGQAGG